MPQIVLKRVYDSPSPSDGYRVLVDKLWPRGISHERLPYDLWAKDFAKKYADELENSPQMQQFVASIADKPKVTLLYASHDQVHNQAEIIQAVAEKMLQK